MRVDASGRATKTGPLIGRLGSAAERYPLAGRQHLKGPAVTSVDESAGGLSAQDIETAADSIRPHIRRTPVLRLGPDVVGVRAAVALKLESQQVTGSFKARNAFAFLLSAEIPAAGVVALSGGNFGLAMAHAARELRHPITVFVPESATPVKVEGMRALGASVEIVSGPIRGIFDAVDRHVAETGALFAHPYDQVEVVAGAGTCGMELDEQCPDLDTVLVAVGGGGLIGGVATWFADRARVVAVETDGTSCLNQALAAGQPVEMEPSGIGSSALGAPMIGDIGWDVAQRWVDGSVLVSDEDALEAQQRLWEVSRIVAEPGGSVALAALTSGAYTPDRDERVGVIICGANTDPAGLRATAAV